MNIMSGSVDPDDAPELTAGWFDNATLTVAGKAVNKGGRPRGSSKEQVSLRIDRDIVAGYRAGGVGWQTRMNEELRLGLARSRGRPSKHTEPG